MNDNTDNNDPLELKVQRLDGEVMHTAELLFEQRTELQTLDMKTEYITNRLEEIAGRSGDGLVKAILPPLTEFLREAAQYHFALGKTVAALAARVAKLEVERLDGRAPTE